MLFLFLSSLFGQKSAKLLKEGFNVLEFTVDRRKADIGYLVDFAELIHYHFAYLRGRHIITQGVDYLVFDFSDEDEWSIDDCDLGLDEFEEIDEVPTEDEEVSE